LVKKVLSAVALAAAASLILSGLAAAQGIALTPALEKVVDGAKKEGGALELLLGGATMGGPDAEGPFKDWMKKNFGIDVAFRYTPGGPMGPIGAKLQTEFAAGQKSSSDVWVGSAPRIVPLLKNDMFLPVDWQALYPARILLKMVEAEGRAVRIATGIPSILYNKRRAPEFAKVEVMEDLLKPEWKGKFATTSAASGFDVLLAPSMWGEEKTTAYVTRMVKQVQGLLPCGNEDRLASGEFLALVLDCGSNGVNMERYRDHLGYRVVRDSAQSRPFYSMIPKHAVHPNMGILFTLFISSPEGQAVQLKHWGEDLYEYPESTMRKMMVEREREGVKFEDISIAWWSANPGIDAANNNLMRVLRAASQ
jgi:ABC-type Fe3+ transport system substrate-binding protein